MHRCLQLAVLGAGNTAPNPMVGAVLVHGGAVIGEGYHQKYGEAHAEVNCINNVAEENKHLISQSTLYVSLEPCAHFGKTPPCADLIIHNKIPRVVIGCRDSYKEVNGQGIAKLSAAGIEVIDGVLENEAREINKRFFTFHEKQRPYIILKWAQSNNHKIARAGFSRVTISNEYTNRLVHKWRSNEAGIMIGTNTALHDNPLLTNRLWNGNSPVRIVIDKDLRVPLSHHLLSDGNKTIIFNSIKDENAGPVAYRKIGGSHLFLHHVLQHLHQMKIESVLVEGGAKLLQSFVDSNTWDEARVITNRDLSIEDGIAAPGLNNSLLAKQEAVFSDTIYYYNNKSNNGQ